MTREMLRETMRAFRQALRKLDHGHDYILNDEDLIARNLFDQEIPVDVVARVIAARRRDVDDGRWDRRR